MVSRFAHRTLPACGGRAGVAIPEWDVRALGTTRARRGGGRVLAIRADDDIAAPSADECAEGAR